GDPETQSILTRFRGDLATLLKDCSMGCLTSVGSEVAFGRHSAVSVVIARKGYPDNETGEPLIRGFDKVNDSLVFFSSCKRAEDSEDYKFRSGRLISVTAVGENLEEARSKCYGDIARLELANIKFRNDIGKEL
ncbi:MAG TPA: phosphoribosylglycinamide synthetase C domain-containing protein, partial [Candidatus Rifleibacterium sp.]|nr:phosphoribosylglycinamide synthetase C domain-containing protein [Candidatus Rifleibacterium sp.]